MPPKTQIFLCISFLLFPEITYAKNVVKWDVKFGFKNATLKIGDDTNIDLTINYINTSELIDFNTTIQLVSASTNIVKVSKNILLDDFKNYTWSGTFTVNPVGLGKTNIHIQVNREDDSEILFQKMHISVLRNRIEFNMDNIFFPEVSLYLSHIYYVLFNMLFGAVFDVGRLKALLLKPLEMSISFVFNLLFVPLVGNFLYFFQFSFHLFIINFN